MAFHQILKSANKNKDKLKFKVLCALILSVKKCFVYLRCDKKKNKILQMESFLFLPFFLPRIFSSSKIQFLKDILRRDPFAFHVILAPEIFLRTQDSAPEVNFKFHKCETGLLCPFVKYHR